MLTKENQLKFFPKLYEATKRFIVDKDFALSDLMKTVEEIKAIEEPLEICLHCHRVKEEGRNLEWVSNDCKWFKVHAISECEVKNVKDD